jgi:hypothetical protein
MTILSAKRPQDNAEAGHFIDYTDFAISLSLIQLVSCADRADHFA